MTVRGAAFLGVGPMVGAGIFALLGEAGAVAGSAVWISFLVAGIVAALQGYAVAKLGATYPSSGGIVTFLIQGFGRGHLSAVTSWLLYFAAIIVTAMVSVSFGSYGSALFFDDSTTWSTVLTIAVVLLVAVVNIAGAKFIDRVQSLIVILLLAVFAVFSVVTLAQVDADLLAPETYPPSIEIVSSVALAFFAYLGFTVISFTGEDLPDPSRNLPRAMYLALASRAADLRRDRRHPRQRRPAPRRHDPDLRHRERLRGAPGGHGQPARHGHRRRHGRGTRLRDPLRHVRRSGPGRPRRPDHDAGHPARRRRQHHHRRARQHPSLGRAALSAEQFRDDAGVLDGVQLLGDGTVSDMLWARPSVTVLGIDCPPVVGSAAAIVPKAAARLNLRIPPGLSPAVTEQALTAHLHRAAPWGVHVTTEVEATGSPFQATIDGPAYQAMDKAMLEAYDRPMATLGQGGSIPLCNVFNDTYPDAEIILMGVEEPQALIHAPNESVDPREISAMALSEALFLQRYAALAP